MASPEREPAHPDAAGGDPARQLGRRPASPSPGAPGQAVPSASSAGPASAASADQRPLGGGLEVEPRRAQVLDAGRTARAWRRPAPPRRAEISAAERSGAISAARCTRPASKVRPASARWAGPVVTSTRSRRPGRASARSERRPGVGADVDPLHPQPAAAGGQVDGPVLHLEVPDLEAGEEGRRAGHAGGAEAASARASFDPRAHQREPLQVRSAAPAPAIAARRAETASAVKTGGPAGSGRAHPVAPRPRGRRRPGGRRRTVRPEAGGHLHPRSPPPGRPARPPRACGAPPASPATRPATRPRNSMAAVRFLTVDSPPPCPSIAKGGSPGS